MADVRPYEEGETRVLHNLGSQNEERWPPFFFIFFILFFFFLDCSRTKWLLHEAYISFRLAAEE